MIIEYATLVGEKAVSIRFVCGAHARVVSNVTSFVQRPSRVTACLCFRSIAHRTAIARPRSLVKVFAGSPLPFLLRIFKRTKALLECCFLATRMDARRAATGRIGMLPLREGETLYTTAALDELDDDAMLIESLSQVIP